MSAAARAEVRDAADGVAAPVRVFISYSRKDRALVEELVTHLAPLAQQGRIDCWYDRELRAGSEWDPEVREQLERAGIIVLLVSASFMASEYCQKVELKRALERRAAGTAHVVPVLVRETHLDGHPLSKLNLLPRDKRPVMDFPAPHDPAWTQVVAELAELVSPADSGVVQHLGAGAPSPEEWRSFARMLEHQIRVVDREHDWSDHLFEDLAAEVEIEDGHARAPRRLRRAPSLQAALRESQSPLVLVEGEPGSGKSVSLRHLAAALTAEAAASHDPIPPLPLYVNLNELDTGEQTAPDPELIEAYVRRRIAASHPDARRFVEAHFAWAKQHGRWILLLDSFDEIPAVLSSSQPDDVVSRHAEAIQAFAHGMHGCRLVVASRPYRGPGRMQWPRYRILPLGEERRRRIVRSWFEDDETAQRVLAELIDTPELGGWIDNPLLLSLICAHRLATGGLPASAHAAFESFFERRTGERGDVLQRHGLSAATLREASERLAFAMTDDPAIGLVPTREALRRIAPVGGDPAGTDAVIDALIELRLGRGSLTATHREGFAFFHRRLQEYFATCHVLHGAHRLDHGELFSNERWRETAVTLLQIGAATQLGPLLEAARAALERQVAELAGARPGVFERLEPLPASAEALHAARVLQASREFSWPSGSLHLLGVVASIHAGSAAEDPSLAAPLERLRREADRLLIAAVVSGLRLDQAWAIESASAASPPVRAALITWAFQVGSAWLEDIAFQQAGHLRELPAEVATGIQLVLVGHEVTGQLRRDPTRIATQVRRLDRQGDLLDWLRLLERVGILDRIAFVAFVAGVLVVSFWTTPLVSALLGGAGVVLLALFCHRLPAWVFPSARSFRFLSRWRVERQMRAPERRATEGLSERLVERLPAHFLRPGAEKGWAAAMMATPALLRAYVVLVLCALAVERFESAAPRWATLCALAVVGIGLCARSGAHVAVCSGYRVPAMLWPLVGLVPAWALLRALSWRALGYLAAAVGSGLATALAFEGIEPILVSASGELVGLVLGGVVGGVSMVFGLWRLGALLISAVLDQRHGTRLRRRGPLDADEILRAAAVFRSPSARTSYLRWIRERGHLRPTPSGERWLHAIAIAIELDSSRQPAPRGGRVLPPPGVAWTEPFRAWYAEHADRRFGLRSWDGDSLDELSRLRDQLAQRVRAGGEG